MIAYMCLLKAFKESGPLQVWRSCLFEGEEFRVTSPCDVLTTCTHYRVEMIVARRKPRARCCREGGIQISDLENIGNVKVKRTRSEQMVPNMHVWYGVCKCYQRCIYWDMRAV